MFNFLKCRKAISDARQVIGVELHRQIKEAVFQDESATSEKLSTAFTPGYIYWFVRMGFTCQGIDGGAIVDRQLKRVCDGVLPGKLYDIFQCQLAALGVAQDMSDQTKPIRGANVSPAQLTKLFELGSKVGAFDAMSLSAKPVNFKSYLLSLPLHYES
jgi:hypothetical protein